MSTGSGQQGHKELSFSGRTSSDPDISQLSCLGPHCQSDSLDLLHETSTAAFFQRPDQRPIWNRSGIVGYSRYLVAGFLQANKEPARAPGNRGFHFRNDLPSRGERHHARCGRGESPIILLTS